MDPARPGPATRWRGAIKGSAPRTTRANKARDRAADLVSHRFCAQAPDRLWVADFTYCRTATGWVYTAFVIDVYTRRIVGWKCAATMTTALVQAAVDHAIADRIHGGATDFTSPIHHNDAGPQSRFNRLKQHPRSGRCCGTSVELGQGGHRPS